MKKFPGFLAAAVLLVIILTVSVSAVYTNSPKADTVKNYKQVYEAIYQALDAQQSYLDITGWKVQDQDIMDIFNDVMYNSPEFFYVTQKLSYRYNQAGEVTSLSFTYNMSKTKRAECTAFYEEEISWIVNEVEQLSLTEPEIALYVHDYLISSYSYDETETIFDVYQFLKERKGVCHAWSLCYLAIMRELDIPCFMVISKEMNHSWNLVQIEGEWYHVDLVFDDPQPDRPGQVDHLHFLLSDSAIAEDRGQGAHYGWISSLTCENDQYIKPYWQFSDARMLFLNDAWYYIDSTENSLRRLYFNGHGTRILYLFSDHWYTELPVTDPEKAIRWKGLFSGFGTYGGYLYINTPNAILRLHPVTGETEELLSLDDKNLNIYGMDIHKNMLEYLVGDTPDRTTTSYIEILPMQYTDKETVVESVFLPFTDVSRVSPYYEAIEYLYDAAIVKGVSETVFDLHGTMTRAQFAALLGRIYDYDPVSYGGQATYTDVMPSSWYAPYVAWVTESGFMNGIGGGKFAPEAPVTREQMLTIIASVGRSRKMGTTELQNLNTIDRSSISTWAVSGVDYCYTNGLISERYLYALAPKHYVKRAEIADVLYRFCQMME